MQDTKIEVYKQIYRQEAKLQKVFLRGHIGILTLGGSIGLFGIYRLFSADDTTYMVPMAISVLGLLSSHSYYNTNKSLSKENQDLAKREILNLGVSIDDLV